MKRLKISQKRILELFEYKNGVLLYKNSNTPVKIYTTEGHQYYRIKIDNIEFKLHKIIFLYHKGYLPEIIDHINGDCYDNRIENLREASTYQNRQNSKIYSTNKSGVKNVYWQKNMNKWCVSFSVNGKRETFGYFVDLEEAKKVSIDMRNKYFKEFANHG